MQPSPTPPFKFTYLDRYIRSLDLKDKSSLGFPPSKRYKAADRNISSTALRVLGPNNLYDTFHSPVHWGRSDCVYSITEDGIFTINPKTYKPIPLDTDREDGEDVPLSVAEIDKGKIAVGYQSGRLKVWDVETGQAQRFEYYRNNSIRALVAGSRGEIFTGGDRGEILQYDYRTPRSALRSRRSDAAIFSLRLTGNELKLAAGYESGAVKVFNRSLMNMSSNGEAFRANGSVIAMDWHPHRTDLLAVGEFSGGIQNHLRLLQISWEKATSLIDCPQESSMTSIYWSRNSEELVTLHADDEDCLKLWKSETAELEETPSSFRLWQNINQQSTGLPFSSLSPDRTTIAFTNTCDSTDENGELSEKSCLVFWDIFPKENLSVRKAERLPFNTFSLR